MSAQTQRTNGKSAHAEEATETASNSKVAEKGHELRKKMDEVVDELDDVLEENAEQFIRNFVQRGGE